MKLYKIWLIYDLKFKYHDTRIKIRQKTHNLTWNPAQNDPIHLRMTVFHSAFQKKWKSSVQEANFPDSLNEISLSNIDWMHKSV